MHVITIRQLLRGSQVSYLSPHLATVRLTNPSSCEEFLAFKPRKRCVKCSNWNKHSIHLWQKATPSQLLHRQPDKEAVRAIGFLKFNDAFVVAAGPSHLRFSSFPLRRPGTRCCYCCLSYLPCPWAGPGIHHPMSPSGRLRQTFPLSTSHRPRNPPSSLSSRPWRPLPLLPSQPVPVHPGIHHHVSFRFRPALAPLAIFATTPARYPPSWPCPCPRSGAGTCHCFRPWAGPGTLCHC